MENMRALMKFKTMWIFCLSDKLQESQSGSRLPHVQGEKSLTVNILRGNGDIQKRIFASLYVFVGIILLLYRNASSGTSEHTLIWS